MPWPAPLETRARLARATLRRESGTRGDPGGRYRGIPGPRQMTRRAVRLLAGALGARRVYPERLQRRLMIVVSLVGPIPHTAASRGFGPRTTPTWSKGCARRDGRADAPGGLAGALRALELGWQRLVPCVSNLRRSAVRAIGGDAISGSAPRPSGTGGLQTLCWEVDWNPRFPATGARVCANPGDPRGRVARHLVSVWLGYSETSTTAAGARA